MSRKSILIMLAVFVIFALTACGVKPGRASAGNLLGAGNPSGNDNKSEAAGEQAVKSEEPEVNAEPNSFTGFDGDKPAVLAGSSGQEQKLNLKKGAYLFSMKTKDTLEGLESFEIQTGSSAIPMYSWNCAGDDGSGWYACEKIQQVAEDSEYSLTIDAKGSYQIEIARLPLASGDKALPVSFKGAGTKAVGPFKCDGEITIKLKTDDAKQAGFTAELMNAETGESDGIVYANIDDEGNGQNKFDDSKAVKPSEAGSYFLLVSANGGCAWEAEISK